MSTKKTGFKPCRECGKMMSITDPHEDCIWCLSSDHDVDDCTSCRKMNPKALREREAKLLVAKMKGDKARKASRSRSRRSRSRSRSREGSSAKSASDHASKSRRRHKKKRHESRRRSGKESGSRSRSPKRVRSKVVTVDVSEQEGEASPLESQVQSPAPASNPSPAPSPAREEEACVDEDPAPVEEPNPIPPQDQPEGPQPPFPAPGQDPSAFLNAMYGVFSRAWCPSGAPSGPMGPLAFNLGVPHSYAPAPFMPYMPAPAPSWQFPAPPRSSAPAPLPASPAPLPASPAPVRPLEHPSGPSGSMPASIPTPTNSDQAAKRVKERSRREMQRLMEERRFLETHPDMEEGELEDDCFEDLAEASGLEFSPEWELTTVSDEPSKDVQPYHLVMRKAAELLQLTLPTVEFKSNLLTEVLHSPSSAVEPLLPFNEALSEPVMEVWKKPLTAPAVSKSVARRYRAAPGDPSFLTSHPSPESLVIQAACSKKTLSAFPQVPGDKEAKKQDQVAKKSFSSASMALKSTNATCLMGRYIHALMDSMRTLTSKIPEDSRKDFEEVLSDTQAAARQVIQSGLDTADSVARIMGTAIASRRSAWLKSSDFSADVQAALLDLPFEGSGLFGKKADAALERFKDSRATAKSLGLQIRGFSSRKFRGFGRSSFRGFRQGQQQQQQQQQQQNSMYRSYRGRQRARPRGRQASSSSTSSNPPASEKQL